MTAVELRAELEVRGLETSGFEPELRVRLCNAMGVPIPKSAASFAGGAAARGGSSDDDSEVEDDGVASSAAGPASASAAKSKGKTKGKEKKLEPAEDAEVGDLPEYVHARTLLIATRKLPVRLLANLHGRPTDQLT